MLGKSAPIRSMLVISNSRAGWKGSTHYIAESLQQFMDRTGLVHRIARLPPGRSEPLVDSLASSDWQAVCIAGGDGTVASTVAHMLGSNGRARRAAAATIESPPVTPSSSTHSNPSSSESLPRSDDATDSWCEKPILIVPSGTQNSLARSLGIMSSEDATEALRGNKTVRLQMWELHVRGAATRDKTAMTDSSANRESNASGVGASPCDSTLEVVPWFASVSIGTMAGVVRTARQTQLYIANSMSLLQLKRKYFWAALYEALWLRDVHDVAVSYTDATTGVAVALPTPLRMCLVSRVPWQHKGYSLTPHAAGLAPGTLALTVATSQADPWRMLHLLLREAPGGNGIECEDGVSTHVATRVAFTVPEGAAPLRVLVDGETFSCDPGMTMELCPGTSGASFFCVQGANKMTDASVGAGSSPKTTP